MKGTYYQCKKISMEELREVCNSWAGSLSNNYKPDYILFVAKSGYIVADEFRKVFAVPMGEIGAHRAGGGLRKLLAPVFRHVPLKVRSAIVGAKSMYKANDTKTERFVEVEDSLRRDFERKYQKILVIDDSIDTGWTFINVCDELKKLLPEAEIKTAALIQMNYSKDRFRVDYHLFEDELLLTPAQTDSKEYKLFLQQYQEWKKGWIRNEN